VHNASLVLVIFVASGNPPFILTVVSILERMKSSQMSNAHSFPLRGRKSVEQLSRASV
jgi:hypothetical protein